MFIASYPKKIYIYIYIWKENKDSNERKWLFFKSSLNNQLLQNMLFMLNLNIHD